ncbi:putative cleavage induced protein [Thraustotheca clavata]|uniref:Putative cleavage induced protein n=1 Tax=Thraustotheca clavata TaxID=74557 RepID=A0A1V9YI93_9STRA|nr:putative cleavage induced protein [Thraustotheca clavata]
MSSAYESDGGVSDGALSKTSTHLDIGDDYALRDVPANKKWSDEVVNEFITDRKNQALRTLTRKQDVRRAQNIRNLHFGGNNLSRVEVPPLLHVKQSQLNIFQFNYAWTSSLKFSLEKVERIVGWANPSLKSLLHYESLTLYIDATFRCTPAGFKQCFVLMVYDKCTSLYVLVYYVLCTSKSYDSYWNIFQCLVNSCGGSIAAKEIICDFEAALITAVRNYFPEAKFVGCLLYSKLHTS